MSSHIICYNFNVWSLKVEGRKKQNETKQKQNNKNEALWDVPHLNPIVSVLQLL